MRSVVPSRNKFKAVNRVTPASAIDAAVTPLTVQAMPSPKDREQEILQHDADMQRVSSSSPATGALTAAIAAHSSSSPPLPPPQTNKEDKPRPEGVAPEEAKVEPVTCPCPDHLDEVVARFEMRASAKRVFEYMFSEKLSGPHATHETLWGRVTDARGNSGK